MDGTTPNESQLIFPKHYLKKSRRDERYNNRVFQPTGLAHQEEPKSRRDGRYPKKKPHQKAKTLTLKIILL